MTLGLIGCRPYVSQIHMQLNGRKTLIALLLTPSPLSPRCPRSRLIILPFLLANSMQRRMRLRFATDSASTGISSASRFCPRAGSWGVPRPEKVVSPLSNLSLVRVLQKPSRRRFAPSSHSSAFREYGIIMLILERLNFRGSDDPRSIS